MRFSFCLAALVAALVTVSVHAQAPVAPGAEAVQPERVRFAPGEVTSVRDAQQRLGAPAATRWAGELLSLDVPAEADNATALVVTEDRQLVLSTGLLTGTVVAHEVQTGAFVWSAAVCEFPYGLDEDHGVAVVACAGSGEAVFLDAGSGGEIRRVALPGEPVAVRIAGLSGNLTFVASLWGGIAVLQTGTGALLTTAPAPVEIMGGFGLFNANRTGLDFTPFAPTPDGEQIVFADFSSVRTYSATTGELLASSPLPGRVEVLDLSADGAVALVLSENFDNLEPSASFYTVASGTRQDAPLDTNGGSVLSGAVAADGSRALVVAGTGLQVVAPGTASDVRGGPSRVTPLGGGRAAVANFFSGVTRYDLATMDLLDATPERVGTGLVSAGAGGDLLLVTNDLERVSAVDFAAPGVAVRAFALGQPPEADAPRHVAISPSGALAAVSLHASDAVALIDVATQSVLEILPSVLSDPEGLAFLDETRLVVGGRVGFQGALAELTTDPAGSATVTTLSGGSIRTVLTSEDRRRVVAHDGQFGTAFVYDVPDDGTLVQTFAAYAGGDYSSGAAAGVGPGMAITPSADRVVGLVPFSEAIRVIDTEDGATYDLFLGAYCNGVATSQDGTRALVAANGRRVFLIDLTGTPAVLASRTLPFDVGPAVAFDADAGAFVVANPYVSPSTLAWLDPNTGAVLRQEAITAPIFPFQLVWSAETGVVLGGHGTSAGAPGGLVTSEGYTPLPGEPAQVAVSESLRRAVVAVPGPDVLGFAAAVTVGASAVPAAESARLTPLGTPARVLRVRLELSAPRGAAHLDVYDTLGRRVARLHSGELAAGAHVFEAPELPAGTYLVRLAGTATSVRAVVAR